jgi:hypothetical protein
MHPDSRKYLHDIKHSTDLVADFCSTASYETYSSNVLLKSAVERQFCIIGEALSHNEVSDLSFDTTPMSSVPDERSDTERSTLCRPALRTAREPPKPD